MLIFFFFFPFFIQKRRRRKCWSLRSSSFWGEIIHCTIVSIRSLFSRQIMRKMTVEKLATVKWQAKRGVFYFAKLSPPFLSVIKRKCLSPSSLFSVQRGRSECAEAPRPLFLLLRTGYCIYTERWESGWIPLAWQSTETSGCGGAPANDSQTSKV